MKRLGEGLYQVGSETSSRTYVVDLNGDTATCTCTAWAIARNRAVGAGQPIPGCKHTRDVSTNASDKTIDDLKSLLADLHDGKPTEPAIKCPKCGNVTTGHRDGAIVLGEQVEHYREIVVTDDGQIIAADGWFDFDETSGVNGGPPDQWICNMCEHRWPVVSGQIAEWAPLESHANYQDRS